jgi:hypothetical protein
MTEEYVLLANDIQNCEQQLVDEIPYTCSSLDEVRKSLLLSICSTSESVVSWYKKGVR